MLGLDDILAPLGAATFLGDHLGRRPAHFAERAPPLPGWSELAELLNMSTLWSAETFAVLRDGTPVPIDEYCEAATDRDLQPVQRPVAARVLALQNAGAVLVAKQVETLAPALKQITIALEAGLGAHATADLYVHGTPSALPPLMALTDLLVIPIAGALSAEIDAGTLEHPVAHPRLAKDTATPVRGARLLDAALLPGHRLYVPRGNVLTRRTTATDTSSLLFALQRPIGLDLLQALVDIAVDDPLVRADLPADPAARDAHRAALAQRFAELASGSPGVAAQAQLDQRFQRDLSPYALNAGMVAGNTARFRRNATQLQVVETTTGWLLRAARGAVPIPAGRETQVAWIVARPEFTRAELAAAFPDADAALLDGLVRDLAAMKVIATVV